MPKQKHDKPDRDKKPNGKHIIAMAREFAAGGMVANMFEKYKPEELAKYCLDVAVHISDYQPPIDGDTDEDPTG